jgi:hypothetical protein
MCVSDKNRIEILKGKLGYPVLSIGVRHPLEKSTINQDFRFSGFDEISRPGYFSSCSKYGYSHPRS